MLVRLSIAPQAYSNRSSCSLTGGLRWPPPGSATCGKDNLPNAAKERLSLWRRRSKSSPSGREPTADQGLAMAVLVRVVGVSRVAERSPADILLEDLPPMQLDECGHAPAFARSSRLDRAIQSAAPLPVAAVHFGVESTITWFRAHDRLVLSVGIEHSLHLRAHRFGGVCKSRYRDGETSDEEACAVLGHLDWSGICQVSGLPAATGTAPRAASRATIYTSVNPAVPLASGSYSRVRDSITL